MKYNVNCYSYTEHNGHQYFGRTIHYDSYNTYQSAKNFFDLIDLEQLYCINGAYCKDPYNLYICKELYRCGDTSEGNSVEQFKLRTLDFDKYGYKDFR